MRARQLAGVSIGELAQRLKQSLPRDALRGKGRIGELLERALGASGGSLPVPDFPELGIELKTLPVDAEGRPRESTHVTTVPLTDHIGLRWEDSLVCRKLRRVLWVPVQSRPQQAMAERRIGTSLLWSPRPEQEAVLKRDFEELMEMVCLGRLRDISAHYGTYLQIRPKAADGRARTAGVGPQGERIATLPRGFYLRAAFTGAVLREHYALPAPR